MEPKAVVGKCIVALEEASLVDRNARNGIMEPKAVVGKCMPVEGMAAILSALGGLKEIEGYVIMDTASLAVFEGKVEDGKIPIPQHIRKALSDGDAIKIVVLKVVPKIHPTIAAAQASANSPAPAIIKPKEVS